MKKIAFDFHHPKVSNAGYKARIDVLRTACAKGYRISYIGRAFNQSVFNRIVRFLQLAYYAVLFRFSAHLVFVQFPGVCSKWWLSYLQKKTSCKLVMLIHDAECLREPGSARSEVDLFNMVDEIIVHTPAMEAALRDLGVDVSMQVLRIFDYYVSTASKGVDSSQKNVICFCGNLQKSEFIRKLPDISVDVKFVLYGVGIKEDIAEHVVYRGTFEPDCINQIDGGWGLVWDGSSLSTCATTHLGAYLRYNASHKISLYLAAGKPVIVWKESAMANFVRKHGCGICVGDLREIPELLSNLSDADYKRYVAQATQVGTKITKGDFLVDALNKSEIMLLTK